jgi:hypothetical protein
MTQPQNTVTSKAQYVREDNGSVYVFPILADGSVGQFEQRIGHFRPPVDVTWLQADSIYTFVYTEKPAPSGNGNYRDLLEVVEGDAEPTVRPSAPPARAPSYAPATEQSPMTFKDQLIVDQVILKGSVDLQVSGVSVEKATSQVLKAWRIIRARHNEPVKKEPPGDGSLGVLRADESVEEIDDDDTTG